MWDIVQVAKRAVLAAAIAMKDMTCVSVVTAPELGHLQCVNDHGQIQPALVGWDVRNVAGPRPIGGGNRKVAIQQVRCDRRAVSAVGGGDTEASLPAGADTTLLHEPLHTLLADALSTQFPPDARSAVSSTVSCIYSTNMQRQRLSAQVTPPSDFEATNKMLMVASHTYPQHPAMHADRPHTPIASTLGVLHFCPLAKYAIAFPRMSRSIVTRARSARKRLSPSAQRSP